MSAFDASSALEAVEALFGVAAVYVGPAGGGGTAVIVVPSRGDGEIAFGGARVIATRGVFEARKAAFENPERGGTLSIGSEAWRIAAPPEALDPDRLIWTLRCEPA